MKMTKHVMVALVAVASALSWQSAAQAATQASGRFGGARAAQWRERMQDAAKDLNLSEDQKAKLKTIYQPQMEQLRELWKDQSLSREQKMEKLKALRGESEPKLKEVLTAEQWEKWQRRQTQTRERMQATATDWNITAEQKAKLKSIFQPEMEKFRALRQDKNLTPQEKQEKFKALRKELSPQIKEVLTPEQYEKWEKARAQGLEKARDHWQQRKQQ